jgi:hypothetical protein
MIMYDILKNANQVSLAEIIQRQTVLIPAEFLPKNFSRSTTSGKKFEQRKKFLETFYISCTKS